MRFWRFEIKWITPEKELDFTYPENWPFAIDSGDSIEKPKAKVQKKKPVVKKAKNENKKPVRATKAR